VRVGVGGTVGSGIGLQLRRKEDRRKRRRMRRNAVIHMIVAGPSPHRPYRGTSTKYDIKSSEIKK